MKVLVVFTALAICILSPCLTQAGKLPKIEQGIYVPESPFENMKQSFYVLERERPSLDLIRDASTSIAIFLIDVANASSAHSIAAIRPILSEARDSLRLPPIATFDNSTRFVDTGLYCWSSKDKDHLEFLIEWGDVTTNARYTDSYVFVRRGSSWYFEKHGSVPPWHWKQTERYFQRRCPPVPAN